MRMIAKLTIFDNIAHQTNKFKKNIYLGCPVNIVNMLSEQKAQELFVSFVGNVNPEVVKAILTVARMPIAISGLSFNEMLNYGSDKYVLGYERCRMKEVSVLNKRLGTQALALSLDIKNINSEYYVLSSKNRTKIVGKLNDILKMVPIDYFGELILNLVELDGSRSGLDFRVLSQVNVTIPTLISCGFTMLDSERLFNDSVKKLDGVVFCSSYCLEGEKSAVLVNYPENWSVK